MGDRTAFQVYVYACPDDQRQAAALVLGEQWDDAPAPSVRYAVTDNTRNTDGKPIRRGEDALTVAVFADQRAAYERAEELTALTPADLDRYSVDDVPDITLGEQYADWERSCGCSDETAAELIEADPTARCRRCGVRGRLTEVDPEDLDEPGPLTCERCGARVHNLSADGQCITCIAGAGTEPVADCAVCDTAAVFRSELGQPARWTHLDIVAALAACGGIAHAPAIDEPWCNHDGPELAATGVCECGWNGSTCTCCEVRTDRPGAPDDECPKCGHLMSRHYRTEAGAAPQ